MWRLMNMTFYGNSRVRPQVAAHVHESPASMTVPLMLLAAGSVLAGWLGTPKAWTIFSDAWRGFPAWLQPVFASAAAEAAKEGEHSASTEWILMALSVAIAIIGISLARYFYCIRTEIPDRIQAKCKPLHTLLYNKWYVDELYDFLFVNGLGKGGGRVLGEFDRKIVDGGVNGAGWLTRASAQISMWWDTWIVDGSVRLGSAIVYWSSWPVRLVQDGELQEYMLVIVFGLVGFLGYAIYLLQNQTR
jgi:NADH-quinone oxidoreductase subunit L